jgi:hypothetical protein
LRKSFPIRPGPYKQKQDFETSTVIGKTIDHKKYLMYNAI